jgi:hypothetical protein
MGDIMAQTRTRKATPSTRDASMVALQAYARTLPTSAAIADALGVSGKTVRGRVRAGTLRTPDGVDVPAPVKVSKDGQSALTDAHKDAISYTFAPQDDDALAALVARLS